MKRIYLIDCPGIVPRQRGDTSEDLLLRGVVRGEYLYLIVYWPLLCTFSHIIHIVENVSNPEQYIPGLFRKVKPHHLARTYEVSGYKSHVEFLELLARKSGRLLKGGEPDVRESGTRRYGYKPRSGSQKSC